MCYASMREARCTISMLVMRNARNGGVKWAKMRRMRPPEFVPSGHCPAFVARDLDALPRPRPPPTPSSHMPHTEPFGDVDSDGDAEADPDEVDDDDVPVLGTGADADELAATHPFSPPLSLVGWGTGTPVGGGCSFLDTPSGSLSRTAGWSGGHEG
jgi:hypothetical protein